VTALAERTAPPRPVDASGTRSYEVYQRLRVHEVVPGVTPKLLWNDDALDDPTAVLGAIREFTPCYRDWIGNAFWVTRYDDVTSVFVDDANYETRTKRWRMGLAHRGRDLRHHVAVHEAEARRVDAVVDEVADRVVGTLGDAGDVADLAIGFAGRLAIELLAAELDLDSADVPSVAADVLTMHRGTDWRPRTRVQAVDAFERLAARFDPLVEQRRADPGDDVVSAIATLDVDGAPTSGVDVAATLLERDLETLHGGLANLWFLLLTHPDQRDAVGADRMVAERAWLEAVRHSPPTPSAERWTRHEVERFGRLLPEGALVICSALAANRDPRQFAEPDRFDVLRADLCQREPRGHYRADGLPSGIVLGTGAPSRFPAVPEDRPRSRYAMARDTAVTAIVALASAWPGMRLATDAAPTIRSLTHGGMRTCWYLPVELRR
jgi:pulcherriminic acid synthase